ncbi:MAG: response regulator, partial [Candidatus Rokubacteria bacterium]|nr:response regulator [Candidatus Rokubacteria bacterium]
AASRLQDVVQEQQVRLTVAQQQVLQAEKLSALSQVVAGVAHELNNPLSVVAGQTALLRQMVGSSPLAERAEKIAQAADRCARIVRNFLTLARQHPPERQRVRLNQIVREAVELLAYPFRVDDIEVTLDLGENLPVLWADPNQLHQVVVNLINNAHHAMRETPAPRRLSVATRYDPGQGRLSLKVADTGPGIPAEIQGRIFEPFFTTKPTEQGTGLGLSICNGIIESHGGTIGVESQPGQGAVFWIELPVGEPPGPAPESGGSESAPPIRGRAILVVDDELEVAEVLADMLAADGHQVETAANGALGLEKLGSRPYDLILCDIKMPELDGPGLYREVAGRHPGLSQRFIFLTGDTLSAETREFLRETGASCLSKPFAPGEVHRLTQQVLQAQ